MIRSSPVLLQNLMPTNHEARDITILWSSATSIRPRSGGRPGGQDPRGEADRSFCGRVGVGAGDRNMIKGYGKGKEGGVSFLHLTGR